MIYLIGGIGRTGKSTLSMKLIEHKPMPLIPTDGLIGMFRHGLPEVGISLDMSSNERAAIFEPLFFHLVRSLNYGWANAAFEGDVIMPEYVWKLRDENIDVVSCFIGASKISHETLVEHSGLNRWYLELDQDMQEKIRGFIVERSAQFQAECAEYELPYFDMSEGDYAAQQQRALDVLLSAEPDDREHNLRPVAYHFANDTDAYDNWRPNLPPALADVIEPLQGADVVEVGAGTGKFTRDLVERGANVSAVEPIAEMRRVMRRKVPKAIVLAGSAERLPIEDETTDVYVAVEAFHWFDPEKAWSEALRVLRPGGRVLIAWISRKTGYPWQLPLHEELQRATQPNTKFAAGDGWKHQMADHFTPQTVQRIEYEVDMTIESLQKMYATFTYVNALAEDVRSALMAEMAAIIRRHETRETFPMKLTLDAWVCEKRA